MILKSIVINGFKSFGKKVKIDLAHNVTGVVGPNGSGKSNVAEAIRFVLGEQSMKNMRGKLSADLIYKGSERLAALSRASVEIYIDNKDKTNLKKASHDMAGYLDYDEIKLSREVYSDGESKYKINDATVRLRDVEELLAIAGIDNATHTIISQGEADRILLANGKERKEIMEDALGLRVYHLRIKESEKKLAKVEEHKREIEIIKREVDPRLIDLARQVKIIERRKEELINLKDYAKYYLYREKEYINKRRHELQNILGEAQDDRYESVASKQEIKEKILEIEGYLNNHNLAHEYKLRQNNLEVIYGGLNNEYTEVKTKRQLLTQLQLGELGDGVNNAIDGNLNSKDHNVNNRNYEEELVSFARSQLRNGRDKVNHKLDNAIYNALHNNNAGVITNIGDARIQLDELFFGEKKPKENKAENKVDYSDEIYELELKVTDLENKRNECLVQLSEVKKDVDSLNENKYKYLENKNALEKRLRDIEYAEKLNAEELRRLSERDNDVTDFLRDITDILGASFIMEQNNIDKSNALYTVEVHELYKKVEKSKARFEASMEGGAIDDMMVTNEYNELRERREFLDKEIADIESTESELMFLIEDLRASLQIDLEKGIEKISFVFNNYFHEVFGGGSARLVLTPTPGPSRKGRGDNADAFGIEVLPLREDIGGGRGWPVSELNIDVSIPEKRVKDMHMFSGGERSLISIALIFAMSAIAPPPFIVLDETDAALDEINAKRYGQMLNKLAQRSKLLVITHNRQTMNECDALYGITLGSDGASHLLSISFEGMEK